MSEQQNPSWTEHELRERTMDCLVDRDARYVDEEADLRWAVGEIAAISGTEALKA